MRLFVPAAIAAVLAASTLAQAQSGAGAPSAMTAPSTPTSSPSAPPQAVPPKKKDPVICKREEQIGTRLGGKSVCMTKSQWDDQRADAQRTLIGAQTTPR